MVDATLGTLFCNGVITMQSMGIGGGFVANMYIQQKAYTLNARERAPRHSNIIESKFRSNNGHKNEGTCINNVIIYIFK